jgi:hypothetical protein
VFLTGRARDEAQLDAFEVACRGLAVPEAERVEIIDKHLERMNNAGRMSLERCAVEREEMRAYSAGHAGRMKSFMREWLDKSRGVSAEADARVSALSARLDRALGG